MRPTIAQRGWFATKARFAAGATAALVLAAAAPAPADDTAGDLFSVAGVTVDVEAESAEAARRRAVGIGQTRALDLMLRKLTRTTQRHRLPRPEPDAVARLVRGYEVTNEVRSARRYIGMFTVRFDPEGVGGLLRGAGIPYTETRSPPLLVLPVLVDSGGREPVLWNTPNPWRDAWEGLDWRGRLTVLRLPEGSGSDRFGLSADAALAGEAAPLAAIAARHGAAGVLVASARPDSAGRSLAIEVASHGAAVEAALKQTIIGNPGVNIYDRAAKTVARLVERRWLADNMLDHGPRTSLDAVARLDGFESWLALRRSLATLSRVERFDLHSLSTAEATLTLHFQGTGERLRAALAARGIALDPREAGPWRLAATAAVAAPPPAPSDPAPSGPRAEMAGADPAGALDDLFFE